MAVTVLLFLFEGVMPLSALIFAPESATAGTVYLGFPEYFAYVLIACKALGAVALVIPDLPGQIKEWAYAGLAFNFIRAAIGHFVIDGVSFVSFFPFIVLGVLAVSYITYFKVYHPGKEQSFAQV